MVLKQALSMACVCGQAMEFPGGQVKVTCGCGAVWELGLEGFWSITSFVLILAKPKGRKLNHYERYMAWRKSIRGKKGGSKMLKKVAKSVRKVLRDSRQKKSDHKTIATISDGGLLVDYMDGRNVGQRGVTPRFIRPFGMRRNK